MEQRREVAFDLLSQSARRCVPLSVALPEDVIAGSILSRTSTSRQIGGHPNCGWITETSAALAPWRLGKAKLPREGRVQGDVDIRGHVGFISTR